jgi:interferon-induced GTP-binding protein Mx1
MSSQAFYMCMAQYVSSWEDPMTQLIKDVQVVAIQVASRLAELLLGHYPVLQDSLRIATEKVLEESTQNATKKLVEILAREKDPFTLNEFLQQWVNKLRFDRFSKAVEKSFENARNPATNWNGLKEEIYSSMRSWYRETHAISALASAHEMSAIMEAYWNLSAKRFVDNCCMISDKEILGVLPDAIQDQMYQFIKDDVKLQVRYLIYHLSPSHLLILILVGFVYRKSGNIQKENGIGREKGKINSSCIKA